MPSLPMEQECEGGEMTDLTRDAIKDAVREAWSDGYDTAVSVVRDIAAAINPPEMGDLVRTVADALERAREGLR